VVDRGSSRPLPANAAGTTTWLGARGPGHGGDLTRKRSLVGSGDGEEARSKTLLSCHPAERVVAPDLYIRPARDDV
jgi:hypothetical protein